VAYGGDLKLSKQCLNTSEIPPKGASERCCVSKETKKTETVNAEVIRKDPKQFKNFLFKQNKTIIIH